MLSYRSTSFLDASAAQAELARYRRLADDIEMLLGGKPLSPRILAKAPLLVGWTVARPEAVALAAMAIDHPEAASSMESRLTSAVIIENQEAGWVRTLGRFYRLGKKFDGAGGVWGDPSPDIGVSR